MSKDPGDWWIPSYSHEQHNAHIATSKKEIQKSYKEAMSGPDVKFGQNGIHSRIESLKTYITWKLIPRSTTKRRKALTKKWVFVENQEVDSNGNTIPFPEGRNSVRGFEQVQGMDYGEKFDPVVKYTLGRVLCVSFAELDLELDQMDAKTAFLNRDIDEKIYIEIPEEVEIDDADVSELGLSTINEIKDMDLA